MNVKPQVVDALTLTFAFADPHALFGYWDHRMKWMCKDHLFAAVNDCMAVSDRAENFLLRVASGQTTPNQYGDLGKYPVRGIGSTRGPNKRNCGRCQKEARKKFRDLSTKGHFEGWQEKPFHKR